MENKDFSQIHLEDIEIHSYGSNTFSNLFLRNKIKTLSQILDDDLMNEIMINCRKRTRKELTAFISLMKYQYLDIPLANDIKLNEKLVDNQWLLLDFGFSREETYNIIDFVKHNEYYLRNSTMIDIFKKYVSSDENLGYGPGRTKKIMKMYIESYEKSQGHMNIDEKNLNEEKNLEEVDVLSIFKEQLTKLISTRDVLNTQIESLQEKIESLSNHQSKGGTRK